MLVQETRLLFARQIRCCEEEVLNALPILEWHEGAGRTAAEELRISRALAPGLVTVVAPSVLVMPAVKGSLRGSEVLGNVVQLEVTKKCFTSPAKNVILSPNCTVGESGTDGWVARRSSFYTKADNDVHRLATTPEGSWRAHLRLHLTFGQDFVCLTSNSQVHKSRGGVNALQGAQAFIVFDRTGLHNRQRYAWKLLRYLHQS